MKRWLVLLFLLGGCTEPYPGLHEITPPSIYRDYWRQVDSCSGRPRPMTVRFFVATDLGDSDGWGVAGRYVPTVDVIYLRVGFETDPATVRHEMLHAHLLPYSPADPHPPEYFGTGFPNWNGDGKCGALVH